MSCCTGSHRLSAGQTWQDLVGQFFETVEPAMKKIPDSSRRLSDHVLRALNPIRKPSTAGEITELLNRDLELEDPPFPIKGYRGLVARNRRHGVDNVLVPGSSAKVAFPGDTGHAVLRRFEAADVAVHLD
jgi:hypothetical protein